MNRCFRLAVLILIGAEEIAPVTGIASTMDTTMSIETDTLDPVRALARLIVGPRLPVPTGSQFSLDELRDVRWTSHATSQEKREALSLARAILAAGWRPPSSQPAGSEAVEKLKPQYPDYIDDRDGLDWFRREVKRNDGHDMAAVNFNSLGRLIDTIDRLAAALSATAPADGGEQSRTVSSSGSVCQGECGEGAGSNQKADPANATPSPIYRIEHDGFVGCEIGRYTTVEGKRGVVLQQIGTQVVHVYGEKWLRPSEAKSSLLAGGEAGSGGGVAAPSIPGPAACDPADVRREALEEAQPEAQTGSDTSGLGDRELGKTAWLDPDDNRITAALDAYHCDRKLWAEPWRTKQGENDERFRMASALEAVWPSARLAAADAMAEAFRPFLATWGSGLPDSYEPPAPGITMGDLRRATAALTNYRVACATDQRPDAEAGTLGAGRSKPSPTEASPVASTTSVAGDALR